MRTSTPLKITALATAIAVSGGCVSAKMNPGDEAATAAAAPAVVPSAPLTADPLGVTSYTVAKGDHLWGISSQDAIYGTPYNWPLIYKANAGQIKDADLIYPGQALDIPRGMGQAEIDAAVMHAKSRGAWSVGPTEASDTVYLGG